MPAWFSILAKIMSMISLLLPVIEQQFGDDPNNGTAKKQALLGKVDDYLARPDLRAQHPQLTDQHVEAVREIAGGFIDAAVAATNFVDAWPKPEPVPTDHLVDDDASGDAGQAPWALPPRGTPRARAR